MVENYKEGHRKRGKGGASLRTCTMESWQTHGSSGDPVVHSGKSGYTTCTDKIACQNDLRPASLTRGRKKRKVRPVDELTTSPAKQMGGSTIRPSLGQQKKQYDEDIQRKNDQPSELTSAIFMPERHILELILNILQRRDTYEIFAEPVDPKEVEDYYEIIEEPMDFGTMRAKLHEEMYKSLEQFQHDIFLIFNNAMHFNPSRTIYFRQARTIKELAKKLFNILKANPDNFEREFSETIKRDGRRNQKDFKDSANIKLSGSSIIMSSKYMASSSNDTPYRKSFKSNHGQSDIAKHVEVLKDPTGTGKSGRFKSFEVKRRCTYRPYMSPSESESIFQTIYGKLKLLEQVNQQDMGYIESLMLFVEDLGQAVKNIARRNLFGYEIYAGSSSTPFKSNTTNTHVDLDEIRRATNSINLEIAGRDKVVYVNDDIDHDQVEMSLNASQGKVRSPLEGNTQGSQSMPIECDKSYWSDLDHSRASVDKLDCLADGTKGIGSESMTMLLDKSKSNIQEQKSESSIIEHSQISSKLRFRNKCEFQSQSWPSQNKDVSTSSLMQDKIQMQNLRMEHIRSDQEYAACSFEAGKILQSNQTMPPASSFVFNLPYLKTRLDQINSSEHNSRGGKNPCSVHVIYTKH